MRQLTRRTVLAAATAAAATAVAPISGIRPAVAQTDCLKSLNEFLADARQLQNRLNKDQRALIVDQAIKLLRGFYVHLPSKETRYGAKPLERLQQLAQEVKQEADPFKDDDLPFHTKMTAIFDELRDVHTQYRLPSPYNAAHAFLPFKVEACIENGQRKYIVSHIAGGFAHSTFGKGVEVLSWNGVPVEQAVERGGGQGATASARHGLGLARLTNRVLQLHPVPEAETVMIRYRAGGQDLDIEVGWQVVTLMPHACGACNEVQQIQDFQQFLFAPYDFCAATGRSQWLDTQHGQFGYIRIFSFDRGLLGDDLFVGTIKKQIENFGKKLTKGLIIDVRDNGGGSTRGSERIIQFIKRTPADLIEPHRLYFRATQESLNLCRLGATVLEVRDLGCDGMDLWVKSIEHAIQKQETFSDAFRYTCVAAANDTGQIYSGPVIVVTSGLSYSAAEFFAAGFQDHGGMILGVDETTGGGGAGVRTHGDFQRYFGSASPLKPLPKSAGFQVAFRASRRVGLGAGKEIEDVGVTGNLKKYEMTRNDLLNGNVDLKNHAAGLLAQMK